MKVRDIQQDQVLFLFPGPFSKFFKAFNTSTGQTSLLTKESVEYKCYTGKMEIL